MRNPRVLGSIGGALAIYGSLLAGNGTEITWAGASTTSSIFIRFNAIVAVACLLLGKRVVAGYAAIIVATAVELYVVETIRAGSLDGLALKFGLLACGTILLVAASFAKRRPQ